MPKAPEFQGNCHCGHLRSSEKFHGKEDLSPPENNDVYDACEKHLISSERILLSRRSLISTSADIRRSNSRQVMLHFLFAALCLYIGRLSNSLLHLFSVPHPPVDANVD